MAKKSKINVGLIAVVFSLFTAALIIFVVNSYPQLIPSKASENGSLNGDVIMLNQTNPRHGDAIDFTLHTSLNKPYVTLSCIQGDVTALSASKAYFGEFNRYFNLFANPAGDTGWENGGAHCTASLWKFGDGVSKMYAQIEFDVAP